MTNTHTTTYTSADQNVEIEVTTSGQTTRDQRRAETAAKHTECDHTGCKVTGAYCFKQARGVRA